MERDKILVVDDEEDILELVKYNLIKSGFEVHCVPTGEDAIRAVQVVNPVLIILDLMLPGLDGLQICKILKNQAETAHIPILMLTARGEEADIVKGLETGADDYVTKPFSPRILQARVRAVLRRHTEESTDQNGVVRIHTIEINPGRHEVKVNGTMVYLTYTEFRVLQFLAQRPGWVFTRNQIIEAVRGEDYPVTDRSVDVRSWVCEKLRPIGR